MLFLAVGAYLVFMPTTGVINFLSWHNDQRLAQIALLLLTAAYAAAGMIFAGGYGISGIWRSIPIQVQIALLSALFLGLTSSFMAPLPQWALLEWSLMVLLIALGILIAGARRQFLGKFDRLLMAVLLFTATAYVLKAAMAYTAALVERLPLHIWWLLDGFSNPRFFGQFQTMTLPLLVIPAMFWAKTHWSRIGLASLPVIWWMLSIASGTRGTWFAMMVACIAVLACLGRGGHRWLKWQVVTFLVGLVAYWVFFFTIPGLIAVRVDTVNRLSDIANLSFREVLWKGAFDYMVAHPIFGIGPMHFAYYSDRLGAHPHMSLLQWAAEWGVPSALLVLGVVLHAGMSYTRQLRAKTALHGGEEAYNLRLALLASLCAAATQSLVDGVIVMPYSQTLLAVLCGWALGLHQPHVPLHYKEDRRRLLVGAALVGIVAIVFVWGSIPGILGIINREDAFNAHVIREGTLLMPRFWSDGRIYR